MRRLRGDMKIEFGEIVGNQQEGFFATIRTILFGGGNFGFDIAPGFVQGFGEHGQHIRATPRYCQTAFRLDSSQKRLSDRLPRCGWPYLKLSVLHSRTNGNQSETVNLKGIGDMEWLSSGRKVIEDCARDHRG